MHYLKLFAMTLSLFVLTVPVIQAGDVEDINSMVKKKVAVIFDLLGKQDIEKNERNEKIVGELNEIMDFKLAAYLSLGKHWKKISKTQKKEFVETFQQYINNYIVEKIDLYTNQKIDIGDSKIVKKVTGNSAKLNCRGGTSDSRFLGSIPRLELGLRNTTIHMVDERSPISDLKKLTKIYYKILENYFR